MRDTRIYPKDFFTSDVRIKRNQCFFVMPFSKKYDKVFSRLKRDLKESGYSLIRVDEVPISTSIMNKIMSSLSTSQYVIADISDLNPNVFYELGISHSMKESRNVIIIKNEDTRAPSDIGHISYIEYDSDNLMLLKERILEHLEKVAFYSELEDSLLINHICSSQSEIEITIALLEGALTDTELITLTLMLNKSNTTEQLKAESVIEKIIEDLSKRETTIQSCESDVFVKTLLSCLVSLSKQFNISERIRKLLYTEQIFKSEELNIVLRTLVAIKMAEVGMHLDIVLPWIVDYLSISKSCHVDLNRYRIESFLLSTDNPTVNNMIVNSVLSTDRHIREHIADIIGDKRMPEAKPNLQAQLLREDNIYSAASIIEALGKIGSDEDIEKINNWIHNHFEAINNPGGNFVFKHALNAIMKLDSSVDKSQAGKYKDKYLKYMYSDNNEA